MDQWVKFLFNQKPRLLLGGQVPDPQGKWKQLYYNFWSVYQKIHGDHPIYSRTDVDLGTCLPYLIHGDEGRGQLKRPYLVVSWQLLIGHHGLEATNDSGYHGYLYDRHFSLFHEWCHFKPLNQWNLANPWWNKPSGTASRVASCSRGLAAICITKSGRWTICWVNWPKRLLMHMRLVYWSLGLNVQKMFIIYRWYVLSMYVIFYVIWSTSNNKYIWPEPSQQKSPGWFLCCSIRILEAPSCAWSTSGPREIGYSYARFLILFDDQDLLSFQTLPNIIHNRGHYHTQSQVCGNGYVEFLEPSIIPLPFNGFIFKIVTQLTIFWASWPMGGHILCIKAVFLLWQATIMFYLARVWSVKEL